MLGRIIKCGKLQGTFLMVFSIIIALLLFSPIQVYAESYLAQSSGINDSCKREIRRLFSMRSYNPFEIGDNCHNDAGCRGCANEIITFKSSTIYFTSRIVEFKYSVYRARVHGHCPGSRWDQSPDPKGKINVKVSFPFRITKRGILKLGKISQVRTNTGDTRPTWALQRVSQKISAKNNKLNRPGFDGDSTV